MAIETEYDEESAVLRVLFSGDLSRTEMQGWTMRVLRSTLIERVRFAVVDLSDVSDFGVAASWVSSHARAVADRVSRNTPFVVEIILAPDDHVFGYSRMYKTFVSDRFRVEICRTPEDAEALLTQYMRDFEPEPCKPQP